MATGLAKSGKMKRMESKKSHSWWWDSHITPKNKWLQENLEEMDDLVKKMLKLIEEDADSFAKKAELYFKKRPELVNIVEEFYRMYRALAERYDLVSGELRKTIPADLQSQGSGISDTTSDSPLTTQSPNRRPTRSASGPRAAGFNVFLGSGSEANSKEDDNTSTLDSESESESKSHDSSNDSQSNGEENGLQWRVLELETELEGIKEKLELQKEEVCENCKKHNYESFETSDKIAAYEEELRVAKEKFQQSEEEIARLSIELQKYTSSKEFESTAETNGLTVEVLDSVKNVQIFEEDLRAARENLHTSENEVASLKKELTGKEDQLKSARKEVSVWREKFERENGEISKLQDRIVRYKTNLTERDQEIRSLREAMTNANKSLAEENEQLRADITRMTKERTYLEEKLKEIDLQCQSIEEELRRAVAAKGETEVRFGDQIVQLKAKIADRDNRVKEANIMLEELKVTKDELNSKITALSTEIGCKDNQIAQMGSHLHQLHMQHVELIAAAEAAHKQAGELQTRVRELEIEVQRKEEIINEGAEGKREAIRQLCFSLEHYRSGYHQLRQAATARRRPTVMAT